MNTNQEVAAVIVLCEKLKDAPPGIYLYSQDGKCIGYSAAKALPEPAPILAKIEIPLKKETTMYQETIRRVRLSMLGHQLITAIFSRGLAAACNQPLILRKDVVTHERVRKIDSAVLKAPPRSRGRFRQ